MAVKTIKKQKPATFDFDGVTVGVRKPTTAELLEISKLRQEWSRTFKDPQFDGDNGDVCLFYGLQEEMSEMLACDPDDSENSWFAKDKNEQEHLRKNGVFKDLASEVPHMFHSEVWLTATGSRDVVPLAEEPVKSEPVTIDAMEESKTITTSTPSSSESVSTSEAQ